MLVTACSAGSSSATSGAPRSTAPAVSGPPASPPARSPTWRAALAVARRYLTSVAEQDDANARSLAAPAGGDAAERLDMLAGWLRGVPIVQAAGDATAVSGPASAPADDRAVAVALRGRLAGPPPSASVPLGTRVLLLAPADGRWRVVDDVTGDPAL